MVLVKVNCWYYASTACSSSREKCHRLTGACVPRLCAEALLHPRTTYYNQFSVRFAVLGARTRAVHEFLYPVSHGIQRDPLSRRIIFLRPHFPASILTTPKHFSVLRPFIFTIISIDALVLVDTTFLSNYGRLRLKKGGLHERVVLQNEIESENPDRPP
jgi:hypothetical protein